MLNNSFLNRQLTAISANWRAYENYAENVTGFERDSRLRDVAYWRKKLFSVFTVYFVPVSFIALIPGVWMSVRVRMWGVASIDIASAVLISVVMFSRGLSLAFKKICVVVTLYFLAIMLLASLGLFGPGMLYLFGVTVFMSVMFSRRYAYCSVAAHAITCAAFGIMAKYGALNMPVHSGYTMGAWIAFSSNLIFLSVVTVMLINTVIGGLENTVQAENVLNAQLEAETQAKDALNTQLCENASQYKTLFFENPKPMFVADPYTLKVLQANDAASQIYGYTHDEFTALTIRDIRYDNLDTGIMQVAEEVLKTGAPYNVITKHRTKCGQVFPVEVMYNVIRYEGREALLGIANDITEQVAYMNAIEEQNKKLTEIGYIQSHLVRAPLARILGLTQLIKETNDNPALEQEVNFLSESAKELDEIISQVIQGTVEAGNVTAESSRWLNR